jgi:hypothetical protein
MTDQHRAVELADLVAETLAPHIDRADRPAVIAEANALCNSNERKQAHFTVRFASALASKLQQGQTTQRPDISAVFFDPDASRKSDAGK